MPAATSVRIVSVDDRRKVSVLKYRQIKIKDGGEILVKGETLFKGYVSGDLLMQPFDKDGWFATGDLGELSVEGYLRVIGRKDNMFISGGENIHPEEIESILCQHPLIEDAVVVPVEDREFGERPLAFVKFKPGQLLNGRQLTEHLSQFLPKFKIPKQFLSWQEDPAYPAVKPSRRYFQSLANEMGEMGEEGAA
jgi:O-succinylbenzoic acid--CoA ligase